MVRTVTKYETGTFTKKKQLWIRPTFRLENNILVQEAAKDFEKFVEMQNELIKEEFSGKRIMRKGPGIFIKYYLTQLWQFGEPYIQWLWTHDYSRDLHFTIPPRQSSQDNSNQIVELNLKIIEELGRKITKSGHYIVIVDTFRYFKPDSGVWSTRLENFCNENQFGYISLSDHLIKSNIPTQWHYDGHFNETGNEIFAEAMYQWMIHNRINRFQ
jgi:hypothetical protein